MSLNKILINDTTTVNTGIVYDISKAHGGSTYTDLVDALGTDGTNVPLEVREGGMSVKFIHTSDNKYVQYRLMSTSFSTNKADWQSVMSAADKELLDYYNNSREKYLELHYYSGELDYSADEVNLGTVYHGPLDDIENNTVILRAATTEQAGAMSAADKKLLEYYDGSREKYIETDYSGNLSYSPDDVVLGNIYHGPEDDIETINVRLTAATTEQAGVMSAADKTRLDLLKEQLIDNSKAETLPADILSETSIVYEEAKVTLEFEQNHCGSSDGYQPVTKERTISAATSTHAGVMSAADKTKLDEIVSLKGDIPPLSEEELDEILADDGPSIMPPVGDFE